MAKENNIAMIENMIIDLMKTEEEETKRVKLRIIEEITEEIEEGEIPKEEVKEDQEQMIKEMEIT